MNQDLLKSIIFHLVIAILLVVSTWSMFSRKETIVDEKPIVVSLAPLGEKTNLKPAPKREVKPPQPVKTPEVKKPEVKKPDKPKDKPKDKPVEKPKPEKTKDKPPEKPKKQQDELDKMLEKMDKDQPDKLDNLLKDLDKPKDTKSSNESDTKADSKSDQPFDANSPEAVAERDLIIKQVFDQIKKCWSPPAGAQNAKDVIVKVDVDIALDGTMKFTGFASAVGNDPVAQASGDSARRAILDPECNPLRELPPANKYTEVWKEMRITFDPKDLIY